MSCSKLLFLNRVAHISRGGFIHHLLFASANYDIDILKSCIPHDVNHMIDHFLAADLMKNFGSLRLHPLSFSSCKDKCIFTHTSPLIIFTDMTMSFW